MTEMEIANALREFVVETAREHADEILASRTSEVPAEYQMLYEELKTDLKDVFDDEFVTRNNINELISDYLYDNGYKDGYDLDDYVSEKVEDYVDDCDYVTSDNLKDKISDYVDDYVDGCGYLTEDDVNEVVKDNIDSTVEELVGMRIDEYISTMLPKEKFVTHDELDFRLGKRIDHQVLRCTLMNIENSIDSLIVELDKVIRGEE